MSNTAPVRDWTDEDLRREAATLRVKRQQILESLGCAPPGRRDLDLDVGDRVLWRTALYRSTERPGGTDKVLRFWRRSILGPELTEGIVIGARTLQSGEYRKQKSLSSLPEDYVPAHLDVWRTHRIYLVTGGLWQSPEKVLSDDLEPTDG